MIYRGKQFQWGYLLMAECLCIYILYNIAYHVAMYMMGHYELGKPRTPSKKPAAIIVLKTTDCRLGLCNVEVKLRRRKEAE